MEKFAAIVLAAGSGRRMGSTIQKQYLSLAGKPVLYYSLKAFEESSVDYVILVTGAGEEAYCRKEIIERYGITKVTGIVPGGKERYHSVFAGLRAAAGADYVLIHDGARPLVSEDIILRSMETVRQCKACVVGMPVKDTIKVVDKDHVAVDTPNRKSLWQVQTPQTFSYDLIYHAYQKILQQENETITDDAMVFDMVTGQNVKVIEGSYRNIKITTPEDMMIAEMYLKQTLEAED